MRSTRGVVFHASPAQGDLRFDIHAPPEGTDAVCTYIYFHGGGLTLGARDDAEILALAQALTDCGVAFISADYSLYPAAEFPRYIRDAALAVRAIMDGLQAYSLPRRVFIGGSSAGGYLSMMLCFAREYLAEVGLTPEDFAGYILDAGQPTAHFEVLAHRGIDPRRVLVDETAPLYYVRDARPNKPLLIVCAGNDIPGRLEQNKLLVRTLETMGYDPALLHWLTVLESEHCGYLHPENIAAFQTYVEACYKFLTAL